MTTTSENETKRVPALEEKYRGKTVLAVGSHPANIETGAGGTLARLSNADSKVIMLIVCFPHHLEAQMEEAKASARLIGAAELRFLVPDKETRVEDLKSYELIDHMDKLVRDLNPAVVFSHAASNFHLDNVLVHKAVVSAQRLHFFDMFCYCPTNCHPVTTHFHPNVYVDITATMDRKIAAINSYKTQFTCRGIATDIHTDAAMEYGRLAGTQYAEGFEIGRLIFDRFF